MAQNPSLCPPSEGSGAGRLHPKLVHDAKDVLALPSTDRKQHAQKNRRPHTHTHTHTKVITTGLISVVLAIGGSNTTGRTNRVLFPVAQADDKSTGRL